MRLHSISNGAGQPIVFLHGMGTSAASWEVCAKVLSDRYSTVAVDLLGHGASPVPTDAGEYTRDRALVDFDELVAELAQRPVFVGHSLGGYLALAYAATRPAALLGIVVVNTGPGYRDADKREQWNDRSRRNAHRFGVPEQVATLNLQEDSVVMDRLATMTTPTLVLAGSADRPEYTAAGQYLERKMQHARFVAIADGDHSMHESSHADQIAALIADFVEHLN